MGALLDKPNTNKETNVGQGNQLRFGGSGMQGWRPLMEDQMEMLACFPEMKDVSLFGVYDGHGGSFTSDYVKQHMIRIIESMHWFHFYKNLPAQSLRDAPMGLEILKQIMTDSFVAIDREMLSEVHETRWRDIDIRTQKKKT